MKGDGVSTRSRREPKPATEQPGNSFQYLYWRLSEDEFQQLCAAILRWKYDPVECYPVGMADGGIDAIGERSIVYQVKWSSKLQQSPDVWLDKTIDRERSKIRRLVREKQIQKYVLITSVAGTTTSDESGSTQKLRARLDAYSDEFKIPVECWWQADLDAEVVAAPDEIKWGFQEMLAGSEAIRYLMFGAESAGDAARMREVALQVMSTQWGEDSHVKFSQADMDRTRLSDLFVDVHSTVQSLPRRTPAGHRARTASEGTVGRLLRADFPLTFLLGVPGQGKSTLGQYLCQLHRAAILPEEVDDSQGFDTQSVREPMLPFRLDLTDYATWISGRDPFDDSGDVSKAARPRAKAKRSVESFLAALCEVKSGGRTVEVDSIHNLLERFPVLVVFDGLDEVADPNLRTILVEEIDQFTRRMGKTKFATRRFQVVVTARPNASGLAEPDGEMFEVLRLEPLSSVLQAEYVNRWCDAKGLDDRHRNKLRRVFRDRTSLEHVAQLADNPMQLTILLYLISKKGDAVPVTRTPLYSDYMSTLMDREVDRRQISRESVPDVQEVTAFLGWHMQSGVEETPTAGRMLAKDIVTTLMIYFRQTGRDVGLAEQLFKAATDRFWALTSNVDEMFEFAVQPVREYFAARFLAEWAARSWEQPLRKQDVLRRLMDRPYWLNTLRFYAGFASPNELAALRYGVEEALREASRPLQVRSAAWTLLSDGVFVANHLVQRDVARLLADDMTISLMTERPPADFPTLVGSVGGRDFIQRTLDAVESDVSAPLSPVRAGMLHHRLGFDRDEFEGWWEAHLTKAVGTPDEAAWLRVGASYGGVRLPPARAAQLAVGSLDSIRDVVRLHVDLASEQSLAEVVLQAALRGVLSEVRPTASGPPSDLLRALRPQWYLPAEGASRLPDYGHLGLDRVDASVRNSAWKRLETADPRYQDVRKASRKGQRAQGGTTEPWQSTARALSAIHGPNWLSTEIALAGAARHELSASGTVGRDSEPFGARTDYGRLVVDVRRQRNATWWREMYDTYSDDLSRRTLCLALLAVVPEALLGELTPIVDEVARLSPAEEYRALANSSSRLGAGGAARRIGLHIGASTELSPRARLLLAHHIDAHGADPLGALTDDELLEIASDEPSCWPIAISLGVRMTAGAIGIHFTTLAKLGVGTRADRAFAAGMPATVAKSILDLPGHYPTSWVDLAERSLSADAEDDSLGALARQDEWVPDVPFLQARPHPKSS